MLKCVTGKKVINRSQMGFRGKTLQSTVAMVVTVEGTLKGKGTMENIFSEITETIHTDTETKLKAKKH